MRLGNPSIPIESERQNNGIWGTPINLFKMDRIPPEEHYELHSAIIVALSERYPNSAIEIWMSSDDGFFATLYHSPGDSNKENKSIRYKDYTLVDNKLYFVKDD